MFKKYFIAIFIIFTLSGCLKEKNNQVDNIGIVNSSEEIIKEEIKPEESVFENELNDYVKKYGGTWKQLERFGENGDIVLFDAIRSNFRKKNDIQLANNLDELSLEAKSIIKILQFRSLGLEKAPDVNWPVKLYELVISHNSITEISSLKDIDVKYLVLGNNPLTDINPILENDSIEFLYIKETNIEVLPDFSGMDSLEFLAIGETPIKSLENIETIKNPFAVSLSRSTSLQDIDALRRSNVIEVYIDSSEWDPSTITQGETIGTYERFKDWFDKYLPELEKRNPGFKLSF